MRLYRALCAYIEAHAKAKATPAEWPEPEGDNFATTEIIFQGGNHELNGNDRPGHYGRAISLKWNPPHGPH